MMTDEKNLLGPCQSPLQDMWQSPCSVSVLTIKSKTTPISPGKCHHCVTATDTWRHQCWGSLAASTQSPIPSNRWTIHYLFCVHYQQEHCFISATRYYPFVSMCVQSQYRLQELWVNAFPTAIITGPTVNPVYCKHPLNCKPVFYFLRQFLMKKISIFNNQF